MKKKIQLNYETVKHIFDIESAQEDTSTFFKINGGPEPVIVTLPVSIVHRLYRLGQAYNIRQLRHLESNVKLIIGSVEIPEFQRNLNTLKNIVNDEVIHHYANKILEAINQAPTISKVHIAISVGEFYPNRA